MLRHLAAGVLLAALALPGAAPAAAPEGASQTDRLIFAERDWSGAAQGLDWSLERAGAAVPGFMPATGRLSIVEVMAPEHDKPILELHEVTEGRDRLLGSYPPSVDPLVMYFFDSTTRHMAALAGGNPDYIRNRIKEALRRGGAVAQAPDGGHTVTLTPFSDDSNAARMRGFETLRLVISLAPEEGAPIRGMSAEAPAAGYRLQLSQVRP